MSRSLRSLTLLSDLLSRSTVALELPCTSGYHHAWSWPACQQQQQRQQHRWFASNSKEREDAAAAAGAAAQPTTNPVPAPTDAPPPPAPPTGKLGLRSLSEVLGTPLSASLTAAEQASPEGPTEEDMEALFGGPSRAAKAQAQAQAQGAATASTSPQPPLPSAAAAVEQDPAAKLIHPKFGYAALGGVMPGAGGPGGLGSLLQAQPRVHPRRTFAPGQSYEPEDLNAYAERPSAGRSVRQRFLRLMPSAEEVGRWADFKNVAFLDKFVSPAGRLLPRKKTRLPIAEHTRVMRQIKIARQMGFMAHETRLEKQHLAQVREKELREAHERGLV